MGEDKELIGRGGDDTVDAAGRRGEGVDEGRAGGGRQGARRGLGGVTPEGRGEGQSPRVVSGRVMPSVFFDYATYAKREEGGGPARIRGW